MSRARHEVPGRREVLTAEAWATAAVPPAPTRDPAHERADPERVASLRVVPVDHAADPSVGSQSRGAPAASSSYVLPLADRAYDRTPLLRASEVMGLRHFIALERARYHNAPLVTPPELERLVTPLADVAALHRTSPAGQRAHEREFLQRALGAMHLWHEDRGDLRTFWAWDRDAWLAMLKVHATSTDKHVSPTLAASGAAYLFCDVFLGGGTAAQCVKLDTARYGRMLFGAALDTLLEQVTTVLSAQGFRISRATHSYYANSLLAIALAARSPLPADWTAAHVEAARARPHVAGIVRARLGPVCGALAALGYDLGPGRPARIYENKRDVRPEDVPLWWWELSKRWYETSTVRRSTRDGYLSFIHKLGRWIGTHHASTRRPEEITRAVTAQYVAAVVNTWRVGDEYAAPPAHEGRHPRHGELLQPAGVIQQLAATRCFFHDLEDWEWAKLRFRPRDLRPPKHVREAAAGTPRDIDPIIWAKLVWAAQHLTAEDLAAHNIRRPLAYVRAIALLWVYSALRVDELCRLAVGCARYAPDWSAIPDGPFEASEITPAPTPAETVTGPAGYLLVPDNKTSRAFVKAMNAIVVRAIHAWERERPPAQPMAIDRTSRRLTAPLFRVRGRGMTTNWVNLR